MTRAVSHDVRVVSAVGLDGARHWWVSCLCGLPVTRWDSRAEAETAATEHVLAIAVPGRDRCRVPGEHRMPVWERCSRCCDQSAMDEMDAFASLPGGDPL